MKRFLKVFLVLVVLIVGLVKFGLYKMNHEVAAVTPLPMTTEGVDLTATIETTYKPKQMAPTGEPQHPYMAETDTSAMHSGTWESDTHPAAAVFSKNPKVISRRAGGLSPRQCATFTFTSEGYPLILCGGLTSFRLQLLDPDDLTLLAYFDLPMRPSTLEAGIKRDSDIIFTDTSGGAYFYLDNEDRAVLADSKQRIRRIKPIKTGDKWKFEETDSWDMTPYLPRDCFKLTNQNPSGECDAITTVQPDYNGLIWWMSRNGRLGSLDPETGMVVATEFEGEEIQNSFALDENGAYIVSDHAMYHMKLINGMPTQFWRIPYDRGTGRKVGSINQGSGTSPTLFGEDYVTYTDNADDRMNIHVARRGALADGQKRHICQVPVFTMGASVTDNSMIAHGRSIILENNAGYTNSMIQKDYNAVEGGVVRVDVREDESGCDIVWTNDLKVPSVVPKLSLGNGIAYFYSFDLLDNGDRLWSLVGLDFETGKEVIRVPTGTGEGYNNNWASIAIAPNGDTYVGTRKGILKVSDQ